MAHVTIYGKCLTKPEIEALIALVANAACNEGEVVVVDGIESPAQAVPDPIVLILGTPAACADPDLEANLKSAHNIGHRAIWVWPEGNAPAELPPAAANYCYSYVPWDAKKLAAVTADDDVTCFETSTGEKVPRVPTDRNLCVDEEEGGEKKKAKVGGKKKVKSE
jgi:hypothetical protein